MSFLAALGPEIAGAGAAAGAGEAAAAGAGAAGAGAAGAGASSLFPAWLGGTATGAASDAGMFGKVLGIGAKAAGGSGGGTGSGAGAAQSSQSQQAPVGRPMAQAENDLDALANAKRQQAAWFIQSAMRPGAQGLLGNAPNG